jgi:hypothetical protein
MGTVRNLSSGRQWVRRRRAFGVAIISAAVVGVLVDPGPAHAATIPTPPAVCKTAYKPGKPTITSFAFTPGSVNVKGGPKTLSITVKANDVAFMSNPAQNITSIGLTLTSPTIKGVTRTVYGYLTKLTAGTAKNGTWKGTASVPKWTNNGTWKVTSLSVFDAGFGFTSYSPTTTWNNAWPKTLTVASTPDVIPPVVKSLTISPTSVNTSAGTKTVSVTAKVTDNLSGVTGVFVTAQATVLGKHWETGAFLLKTAGKTTNGTFKGKMTVPRWVGKGKHPWALSVEAGDQMFNTTSLTNVQLKAKHFANSLAVTSTTDATKPTIKGLTFTPKSVDARKGPKKVAVTLKASDTLSGVGDAEVTFKSPSGYTASQSLGLSAGKPGSGTWKGVVTIPRCSEPGVWTVSVSLTDNAQNSSAYTSAQLKAKHFTTTLTVQALDTTAPNSVVPATVPHASPAVVTFSEPTLWQGTTNPLSIYDSGTFSSVAGAWTCKNTAGTTVGCNADNADVKTASFKPSSNFTAGHKYTISGFGGIYDTSGNGPTYVYGEFKAT